MRKFVRVLYCKMCGKNRQHEIRITNVGGEINILSMCMNSHCCCVRHNVLTEKDLIDLADRTETELPKSKDFI